MSAHVVLGTARVRTGTRFQPSSIVAKAAAGIAKARTGLSLLASTVASKVRAGIARIAAAVRRTVKGAAAEPAVGRVSVRGHVAVIAQAGITTAAQAGKSLAKGNAATSVPAGIATTAQVGRASATASAPAQAKGTAAQAGEALAKGNAATAVLPTTAQAQVGQAGIAGSTQTEVGEGVQALTTLGQVSVAVPEPAQSVAKEAWGVTAHAKVGAVAVSAEDALDMERDDMEVLALLAVAEGAPELLALLLD